MTEKEKHRFYHSSAWQRKRQQILRRDHYECRDCRDRVTKASADGRILKGWERRIGRAVCVHHIIELTDKPELGLDPDNLISLCGRCHNERHGRTAACLLVREKKKKPATEEKW